MSKKQRRPTPSSGRRPSSGAAPPAKPSRWSRPSALVLAAAAAGLIIRLICVFVAPQNSYLPDHIMFMGWSDHAFETAPWRIYEQPAGAFVKARVFHPRAQRVVEIPHGIPIACNYPPLSAYAMWLQAGIWRVLDWQAEPFEFPEAQLRQAGIDPAVRYRAIDTTASRFAAASVAVICDFLLAWGVVALLRAVTTRRQPWRDALAFSLTILAPPVFLDSSFWTQVDSWITCLLVWCLVTLIRRRFVLAGVLYGAALMTKPQAILFGPVFVYIFFALRFMPGGSWRAALSLWKTAVVAVAVVAVIALPVTLSDWGRAGNDDGPLRWFQRSYVETIGSDLYQRTTFSALNLWWLHMLAQWPPAEGATVGEWRSAALSLDNTLLGIPAAAAGKALLGLTIIATWVLCARRWRWRETSWVACAYVVLLAAFTLPTAVHERYIYYCIPLAIALAIQARVWIFPAAALTLVGTFEMVQFLWLRAIDDPAVRMRSGLLATLTVAALVYSLVVLTLPARRAASSRDATTETPDQ